MGRSDAKPADKVAAIAAVIAAAIARQCRLQIDYDAAPRVFEPHTLGEDAGGEVLVCGYQVSGASLSGAIRGWKMFALARIGDVVMLDERFHHPRAGYQHDDPGFARITAQL